MATSSPRCPDEEIVKGYEYAKGHHVLIDPKEIDELKLEAKHTIDMVRFVGGHQHHGCS
jgi:DNA end-binding protein Ku